VLKRLYCLMIVAGNLVTPDTATATQSKVSGWRAKHCFARLPRVATGRISYVYAARRFPLPINASSSSNQLLV
jgi:hypothetical protein